MLDVKFEVSAVLKSIDAEAIRVQASYSGPETYWLFYFRSAMEGFSSRLYGARIHYNALHSWFPPRHFLSDADYHIASTLFNMDSALECLVFGTNALGCGKDISQFLDITKQPSLRQVTPANIIGKAPCSGYATYFPSIQSYWIANRNLIEAITDIHDVSKHRHALAGSGKTRSDPPPGFFAQIPEELQSLLSPFEECILGPEPKLPIGARTKDWRAEPFSTLEQIMGGFKPFIEESLNLILADAKKL